MVNKIEMNQDQITTETLRRDRDRFRHLSAYLLQARENEAWRIARELHDQIGQSLTAVKLRLQSRQDMDEATAATQIVQVTQVVESALEMVSHLASSLRPPQLDFLGLGATLNWYLQQEIDSQGPAVRLHDESAGLRLDWRIETVCFRVVQEALTNVSRHASARQVSIELRQDKRRFHLRIEDDGKGFDLIHATNAKGLGLLRMEEGVALTGGTLNIDSVLRRGTIIHAAFPLKLATPRVRQRQRADL